MKYVVETQTLMNGWLNVWTIEGGRPELFDTPEAAFTALAEFFEGLGSANMTHSYNPEDYRVVELCEP
jgi:hypothetical protein